MFLVAGGMTRSRCVELPIRTRSNYLCNGLPVIICDDGVSSTSTYAVEPQLEVKPQVKSVEGISNLKTESTWDIK